MQSTRYLEGDGHSQVDAQRPLHSLALRRHPDLPLPLFPLPPPLPVPPPLPLFPLPPPLPPAASVWTAPATVPRALLKKGGERRVADAAARVDPRLGSCKAANGGPLALGAGAGAGGPGVGLLLVAGIAAGLGVVPAGSKLAPAAGITVLSTGRNVCGLGCIKVGLLGVAGGAGGALGGLGGTG
jgi:hypothetical protein